MTTQILKIFGIAAVLSLTALSCDVLGTATPTETAGFLRSANGGTDWQQSNAAKDNPQANWAAVNVSMMKFKPNSTDVIYAGTYLNGMLISEDGGTSWSQILNKFAVHDFVFDPENSDVIYAAGRAAGFGRVLVTRDAGKSWQEIYKEGTSNNWVRTIYAETGKRLYIGLDDGNLVRSNDGGLSWQLVKNFENRLNVIKSNGTSIFVLCQRKGLYRSDDGGQSFNNITGTVGYEGGFHIFSDVGTYNQLAFGNSSIYLSTDNGLFRSFDQGQTWTRLVLPLQDQSASIVPIATAPANDSLVYTAVGSTIYKSTDGGNTWQTQNSPSHGFVNALLVSPQNPQLVYGGIGRE